MQNLQFVLSLLSFFGLFFFLANPLTTLLHELGHAIAALILTKKPVIIYVGSYGDPKNTIKFKVGKLTIYFRYNPFKWKVGLCLHDVAGLSINKNIAILFAGPLASLLVASVLGYYSIAFDLHGSLKLFLIVFLLSAVIDLFVNLFPRSDPTTLASGKRIFNDGYQIQILLFYKFQPKAFKKALSLFEQQNYVEAAVIFEKLLGFRKYTYIFQLAIASYLQVKNFEKAKIISEEFQFYGNFDSNDYSNFGLANSMLGCMKEAMELYDKSLQLDPNHIYSLNNKGYALNLCTEYEQAIPLFDRVIELDQEFAYAYNNRGLAKVKLGVTEEGLSDINHSLTLDPVNSYAFLNLGIYHFDKGEFETALQLFEKAKDLDASTYLIDKHVEEAKFKLASASEMNTKSGD